MANAIEVSDSLSNAQEQIERASQTVGSGARRGVFEVIYHHKTKVKAVSEIAEKTGLSRIRVLQEGRHLARKGIVRQTKKDGEVAYEKIDFFHAHKKEILAYASNPNKLAQIPTKRKMVVTLPRLVQIPSGGAQVQRMTIDDVSSFAAVKRVKDAGPRLDGISEKQFKEGVQAVLGEPGQFKDWGGEKSDLYSTRLKVNGKRYAAAFAFKGRGERGKLVPGRMGKNGDQMSRLFQEDADIFFVQHWREIDPSVIDLMKNLAIAKSVTTGRKIKYGIIDGHDSERLRLGYPLRFAPPTRRT